MCFVFKTNSDFESGDRNMLLLLKPQVLGLRFTLTISDIDPSSEMK